jgi:guanine deaminase
MTERTLHLGALLHVRDDPELHPDAIEWSPEGALLVEGGHIVFAGQAALAPDIDGARIIRHDGIIAPGFIDAHIHFPQTDIIGAYGKSLLDWLSDYTFPLESRFSDPVLAAEVAEAFLDEILRNGVTTALVFATQHVVATEALFIAAQKRSMRLIGGKVLMDRGAPPELLDAPGGGIAESEDLIQRWHRRDRLLYAITPRFAVTSTDAQLQAAGELAAKYPDVYVHTHLAENKDECAFVQNAFPGCGDYLGVYEKFGLVRPRSVFAHAIHMPEDGFARMAKAEACAAFCPSSNLFLGSGYFDLKAARAAGALVAFGSDVGGGTSFSMLSTMAEGYKVCKGRDAPLNPFLAFYIATLGAARALKLDHCLGDFSEGKEADFIVLDPVATPIMARRAAACTSLPDLLFAMMILGDDRTIKETWVNGSLAHARDGAAPPEFGHSSWKTLKI